MHGFVDRILSNVLISNLTSTDVEVTNGCTKLRPSHRWIRCIQCETRSSSTYEVFRPIGNKRIDRIEAKSKMPFSMLTAVSLRKVN